MKPIRLVTVLALTSSLATTMACRGQGDRSADAGTAPPAVQVDLYQTLCDGSRFCDDVDYRHPDLFFGAHVGVTSCAPDQRSVLFGSWSVGDAESRPFEWEAEVRPGGVFPSLGHVGTTLGCGNEHPQAPSPEVEVAMDPAGFAWAKLEGDDVFIPMRGTATIDHEFPARAVIAPADDGSAPRATVSVEGPDASAARHGDLGPGDSFPWGDHRAAVVRIVAPQDTLLGAIGWVEVHLSGG